MQEFSSPKNAGENIFYKMLAILFRPQCVKHYKIGIKHFLKALSALPPLGGNNLKKHKWVDDDVNAVFVVKFQLLLSAGDGSKYSVEVSCLHGTIERNSAVIQCELRPRDAYMRQ